MPGFWALNTKWHYICTRDGKIDSHCSNDVVNFLMSTLVCLGRVAGRKSTIKSHRLSPSRKVSITMDLIGSLASSMMRISFPACSYDFRKAFRSSRIYCRGLGSSSPCSRNFLHCCIIVVVGPHPRVHHCMTRYAVTISNDHWSSRRISCHTNHPRGSLP